MEQEKLWKILSKNYSYKNYNNERSRKNKKITTFNERK